MALQLGDIARISRRDTAGYPSTNGSAISGHIVLLTEGFHAGLHRELAMAGLKSELFDRRDAQNSGP